MFKSRFARIKELSDRRRLPRLGKIRLGVKDVSQKTGGEFPRETDYFVVPPEVARVYGERPTSLDVMVPINEIEAVFPQAYKWYGGVRGLKCVGDGEVALRLKDETQRMLAIKCPCEHLDSKECQRRAHLMVILPKINMGGIYQIDVGSYHSIIDVNSGLDYVQALIGRFAMVPLRLCRSPKQTHAEGGKQLHYTLQLFLDADVDGINALRENTSRVLLSTRNLALPPPEEIEESEEVKEESHTAELEKPHKLNGGNGNREEARIPQAKEIPLLKQIPLNPMTPQQENAISKIARSKGINLSAEKVKSLSYDQASQLIRAIQVKGFDAKKFFEEMAEEVSF
jgi:hypothetical protein